MKILAIHKKDFYYKYEHLLVGRKVKKWKKCRMTVRGYCSGEVTLVSPVNLSDLMVKKKKFYFYAIKLGD